MRRALSHTVILGFAAISLAACRPEDEAKEKRARQVETVVVKATSVSDTLSTTGEISARVTTDLSFRGSGRIKELSVDVGDHVQPGQVLARIDPEEQNADLQVALAGFQSALAQQTQAMQTLKRQQSLFTTGVTTQAALDDAQEGVLTAQATVQSAQSQVDTARDALDQTNLKADASGVITARSVEVGQIAQAAAVVFTLAHDGPRDAVINADESALLGRAIESDVDVKMLSGAETFKAKVREVSPTIDTTTGTIRVKLSLEGAGDARLGSSVIATARYVPAETIELPWSAMGSYAGRPAVWIVHPETNSVSLRPVDVSNYRTEHFSVRSGVAEGDIVVSNGTKFLSDGQVVDFAGAAK
ncbi:efflux RND transporter periplasmic adaptor subunit [Agrobacterium sp. rho-13.3]|uniref:efflux RND transporter periplasmic adaptor subunit n=1 Tax=Agrobacterium sp. rho-13.3 TaxID=3072980 RepID=UPI002A163AC7|nr:efflux RND transporter periplasmic adaptor subunit [Agrobacterium sp. rho-13.3]MDX8306804.1 efflux RND transporter periplasmic adaptor subunit [Agrobacterium sp. rho-13.3]MDX8306865.1 efflux RND transporter periplasmic adaptor subunit [Agrobacterium sp. rho-13.3]